MSGTRKAVIALSYAPQFPDGIGRVPNNPVIAAAFSALFKGGPAARCQSNGWIEEKSRVIYRHHGRLGGVLEIYFGGEDQIPIAQQWELIESLETLIADTLASILAHVCEPSGNAHSMYPACQSTRVTAATVLAHKQFRRWGDERRTLMRRIAQDVETLSMLRVDLHRYPAQDPQTGRWNNRGISIQGDRLLDIQFISSVPEASQFPAENRAWLVRVGQWGQLWLNLQTRVWTSPLQRQLLMLDHRTNRGASVLAKKIGLSITMLWGAARRRSVIERRIGSLLESIGELPRDEHRTGHWAGRMCDRFDDALLILQKADVFGQIEWPDEFRPGSFHRTKGWVDPWLSSKIRIHRLEAPMRQVSAPMKLFKEKLHTVNPVGPHAEPLAHQTRVLAVG
jgi:hypothetical protein